jgi:hypothetical protein
MNNTLTDNILTHTDAMLLRLLLEGWQYPHSVKADIYETFLNEIMDGNHHISMGGNC